MKLNILPIFCFLLVFAGNLIAHDGKHNRRTATAIRVNPTPPKIDGKLDDEIWKIALIHGDFLQSDPEEGKPETEKTTFQIAYDDEAIYVGIVCHDSEPNKIISRLGRRDDWMRSSDNVAIILDPHHDHQSGYWFGIYPSSTVTDGVITNDGWRDETWNGVWKAKAEINEHGWIAEYKIPFHVIRFTEKEKQIWGVNVQREIGRKNESNLWQFIGREESGSISNFGHLVGLEGIDPPAHLEFVPYAMGRSIFENEKKTDLFGNFGTDLRYGITSSISLNATINPDFGQVEADPERLNLSAFEDYFEERRPFFIEGRSVFQNSDYDLFYSRRIGKRPGHFPIPDGAKEIDRPEATTIISAAKITGKTQRKTSFGILNAITSPEYAQVEIDGKKEDHLIEPMTNYFVGRMKQDILENSWIGGMATAVNRRSAESGYAGAIDWDVKFNDKMHQFSGTIIASSAGKTDDRKSGYIAHVEYDKRKGWWNAETTIRSQSPNFEINDLGFMRRSDRIEWEGSLGFRRDKEWWLFRKAFVGLDLGSGWNYDRVNLFKYGSVFSWFELKSYWSGFFWIDRSLESMDDSETFRGGPLMKDPASASFGGNIRTDHRKMIQLRINLNRWISGDGGSGWHFRGGVNVNPASNIEMRIGPSYNRSFSNRQWVQRIEDQNGDPRYIFAELDRKTLDLTTRASISFTPNLSFQFYLQPYIAIGDYKNFKEPKDPENSYKDFNYDLSGLEFGRNLDFHRRSLRSNAVLRWEFRPGSVLFLVWSQNRSENEIDGLELEPFGDLRESFTDDGSNLFLIKMNYWFGV